MQYLQESKMSLNKHMRSEVLAGVDGKSSLNQLALAIQKYSLNSSANGRESNCLVLLHILLEKEYIQEYDMTPWLLEQSKVPSETWYQPSLQ